MNKKRVLIVEDNQDIGRLVAMIARESGLDTVEVDSADAFKQVIESDSFDLLVLDVGLPGTDGIELMTWMSSQSIKSSVILISGMGEGLLLAAKELGLARGVNVVQTLSKPLFREDLTEAFNSFLS